LADTKQGKKKGDENPQKKPVREKIVTIKGGRRKGKSPGRACRIALLE